jgi:hypothetical protein
MGVGVWPEDTQLIPDELFAIEARTVEPHSSYRHDPIGWAVDKLGIPRHTLVWTENSGYAGHQWDGTVDPLVQVAQALANNEDVGVESGTTTGKTFFAAVLILWFLACWEGARVFTFALKEDQLRLYIWMEMAKLFPRFQAWFPSADMTDLRVQMIKGSDAWAAHGYAVGVKAGEREPDSGWGECKEHCASTGGLRGGEPRVSVAGAGAVAGPGE